MGQPLLLWAFLNLNCKKSTGTSLGIIAIFPFYSHFGFIGPFALAALFIYAIYLRLACNKKVNALYSTGVGLLFLSFIAANINIVSSRLFGAEPSHRDEWSFHLPSFIEMVSVAGTTIIHGQYHSALINSLPLIFLLAYALWKKIPESYNALTIMIAIAVISCFHGFYRLISVPMEGTLHLLTSFQFDRFTVFIPFMFTLILIVLYRTEFLGKVLLYAVIFAFSAFSLYNNSEYRLNWLKWARPNANKRLVTFESFFSTNLFNQIDDYIDRPKESYRVVSIGMHPVIAQFNGFYTLDSYHNNYPKVYKTNFRQVIVGELNKNKDLKEYFDRWGNRCYVFSAELKQSCYLDCAKNSRAGIKDLDIDVVKLKAMGARYIFSAVPIQQCRLA